MEAKLGKTASIVALTWTQLCDLICLIGRSFNKEKQSMGWNWSVDWRQLEWLGQRLHAWQDGTLNQDDRLTLEAALSHLHKKNQTALTLFAMGYSKRHVARLMDSKEASQCVLRAERALLAELQRMKVGYPRKVEQKDTLRVSFPALRARMRRRRNRTPTTHQDLPGGHSLLEKDIA